MTQQEFESFIEEQKKAGMSEEEISVVFCKMFQDGKLNREQLEACLAVLGYEMSDELKNMPDEELKEKILVEAEEEGDGVGGEPEEGKEPPVAPKSKPEEEVKEKVEEKVEEKPEEKPEPEAKPEDKPDEEDEEEQAMRLFGIKK